MTKFLISFPSEAMQVPDVEMPDVMNAAHAVMREAQEAGVAIFGGGIDELVAPVTVHADGKVTENTYPQTKDLNGGMTILELPTREDAIMWAAKIAKACRCPQEVRQYQHDPQM